MNSNLRFKVLALMAGLMSLVSSRGTNLKFTQGGMTTKPMDSMDGLTNVERAETADIKSLYSVVHFVERGGTSDSAANWRTEA